MYMPELNGDDARNMVNSSVCAAFYIEGDAFSSSEGRL